MDEAHAANVEIDSGAQTTTLVDAGRGERLVKVYRIGSSLFSLVLLVAAALKSYTLLGLLDSFEMTGGQAVDLLAIGVEIFVGIWLLSGKKPNIARMTAILVISILISVVLFRWLNGEWDCGCFGPVKIRPLWTLCLDITALLFFAFMSYRLDAQRIRSITNSMWMQQGRARTIAVSALPIAGPLGVACVLAGVLHIWQVESVPDVFAPPLISVEPAIYKCEGSEGQKLDAQFAIKNISTENVHLLGMESTCSCFVASGLPLTLKPGETGTITTHVTIGGAVHGLFEKKGQLYVSERDGTVPSLVVHAQMTPTSH